MRVFGRGHTRGLLVVYCGDNRPRLARHSGPLRDRIPVRYRLLKIEVRNDVPVDRVSVVELPADCSQKTDLMRARRCVSRADISALLTVPCVLIHEASNVRINPGHGHANRSVMAGMSENRAWRSVKP